MMIILYQISIFCLIIFFSFIGGKVVSIISIICAILWTCTHVFWLPLMLLQFMTIFLASLIGLPLACARDYFYKQNIDK